MLVDQDREALQLCRENAESLGFTDRVQIFASPVERAAGQLGKKQQSFDLVFADPPYAARVVLDILEWVQGNGLLKADGTLVIEHDKREDAPERHEDFERIDQRRFGDTLVSIYRRAIA